MSVSPDSIKQFALYVPDAIHSIPGCTEDLVRFVRVRGAVLCLLLFIVTEISLDLFSLGNHIAYRSRLIPVTVYISYYCCCYFLLLLLLLLLVY